MDTETQVSISPEYDTLRKSYTVLVDHIKAQPDLFCDRLFQAGLATDDVCEFVRNPHNRNSEKARNLIDSVMRCIKKDLQVFNTFVEVLKEDSEVWSKEVIEHLQKTYKDCSNSANESADDIDSSDTSDAESFQSACSFQIEHDPGFICPYCGECSLENFLAEEGCPKKEESSDPATMFPFLNVDALDDDEKKDLEVHLKSEARTMITTFSTLCNKTKQSLCDREVPVNDVTYTLVSLKAFTTDIGIKLIEPSDKLKMVEATSFTDLFLSLDSYMSFFNYRILEHVIKNHGSPDDVKRLEGYISIFNAFCQRNVFEVPSKAFSTTRKNGRKFAVKCSKDIATLKGVQVLQEQVAKIFCLRPSALQLYAIKKGCIELHFLISSKALKHIFILLADQQPALDMIGVKISSAQGYKTIFYPALSCSQPFWVRAHRSHGMSPAKMAGDKQSEGSSVQTEFKCDVTRSRLDSLDDDNYSDYSDGAGYVSCEDTLPTYQSEEEQQKPLLSSYDVKHPVHDGFPSQPPSNEQLQHLLQQQQQLVSQLSAENEHLKKTVQLQLLQGTIAHLGNEYETEIEQLRGKDQEQLRNESRKYMKRLDKTLLEQERLADALKAKDHLEGDMNQLSTEFSAKTDELAKKLRELADQQEECNKLETACDALEKEKNSIQARFDVTCEELKEKKEELVIAEDMHTEVYTQVQKLENHQKELLAKHAEEIQNLCKSLSAMESDRNELATRAMSLGAENTQLTTVLRIKTNELESSEQTCTMLTEKVTSLTSQMSAMSQHVVEEKRQVGGSFMKRLEEVEAQRDKFRSQKEVMMRSLAQRNIEKDDLETRLLDLRHRFDSETKRLKDDLNEANSERMRYQMELHSLSLSSGGSQGFPFADMK